MSNMSIKWILLFVVGNVVAQVQKVRPYGTNLQTFSLEELVPMRGNFYAEQHSVKWISDSEYIFMEPSVGLIKYDAATDKAETLLTSSQMINLIGWTTTYSTKGKYLIFPVDSQRLFRHSSLATYYVYDIETRQIFKIGDSTLQAAVMGKPGSLAYVKNNNVYYVPNVETPNEEFALTTEGVPGEVYFGVTDWIYEEEVFNSAKALWFSPNGQYLAVASFNDTLVPSASYPIYGNSQYPETVSLKYPKAGRTNPVARLQVFKVDDPHSEPYLLSAPEELVGSDNILGSVDWASDTNLVILWLNRRQNVSVLINCDLDKSTCRTTRERVEPKGWIDITKPLFDKTGSALLSVEPSYAEGKRLMHVLLFNMEAQTLRDLTPGPFTVISMAGWNQKTDTVYFIAAPYSVPWFRELWATSNGVTKCLTCKQPQCNHVSASFSPSGDYGIVTCSATNEPPVYYLFNSKDETFVTVKNNLRLKNKLSQYKLPMPFYVTLPLKDDNFANVKLLLPPELDPKKKYPMIVKVYSGPSTSRVKDVYELDYSTYLAANRSFIIASIDVRGSNVLGVDAMFAVNNALGTYEITDTLEAIRRIVTLYSFVDPARIGVWGWSYGGFATTMMLIKDKEHLITCGAAVAPVTSWHYYDSIYTERYMDTPEANPQGYLMSDLTLQAEQLRGRKYLLVHGSGDDNVHYQNSMLLAKRLQQSDIDFDEMSYADENHSLGGVSRHLYHKIDHFWTECFA